MGHGNGQRVFGGKVISIGLDGPNTNNVLGVG